MKPKKSLLLFSILTFLPFRALSQVPQPPPQDLLPPNPTPSPLPTTPTSPLENPLELPPRETSPLETTETFKVTEFEFTGNTVFKNAELAQLTQGLENTELSLSQLLEIANEVAKRYTEAGYATSGAVVYIPQETQQEREGKVEIRVIEGEITNIEIKNKGRLDDYVINRLPLSQPLNINDLIEQLQLLQIDPLFENISATLVATEEVGKSILVVDYTEANPFYSQLSFENSRSPSVGTLERGITLRHNNLLGVGDGMSLEYNNTDGSDNFELDYILPITPQNGTLNFTFQTVNNEVIESPFADIDGDGEEGDIESNYETYEISLNQPILRSINNQTYQEFSLGLTASYRQSQTFLFNEPFPLSLGANEDGETTVFALRFIQEYLQQNNQEVFAVRSQFSLGLDAFNSTVNRQIEGVEEIPDSRFFYWQGQAQYVRLLAPETLFLTRANLQLSPATLLPLEQYPLGGFGSVRGYRQNQILADNGIFLSTEFSFPILTLFGGNTLFKLSPFVDFGTTWNSEERENPNHPTLASIGVGLQLLQGDSFSARLDWGIPLIAVDSTEGTLQENGLYFTLQYSPFD